VRTCVAASVGRGRLATVEPRGDWRAIRGVARASPSRSLVGRELQWLFVAVGGWVGGLMSHDDDEAICNSGLRGDGIFFFSFFLPNLSLRVFLNSISKSSFRKTHLKRANSILEQIQHLSN
jgi:hypothetical protein